MGLYFARSHPAGAQIAPASPFYGQAGSSSTRIGLQGPEIDHPSEGLAQPSFLLAGQRLQGKAHSHFREADSRLICSLLERCLQATRDICEPVHPISDCLVFTARIILAPDVGHQNCLLNAGSFIAFERKQKIRKHMMNSPAVRVVAAPTLNVNDVNVGAFIAPRTSAMSMRHQASPVTGRTGQSLAVPRQS